MRTSFKHSFLKKIKTKISAVAFYVTAVFYVIKKSPKKGKALCIA